jgi:putative CocE/NonD family hydrolase
VRDLRYELSRRVLKLRPPRASNVERRKDLSARMSDGVTLLAEHYVPAGDTKAPLVLMRGPYGRRGVYGLLARALAYEGFQVVIQSCRGTAGSGGRFDRPMRAEGDDGRDTVAWLREQPFYPGRFATFGGSYLGFTQLALPPKSKTELFGAVLQIAPSGMHDSCWPDDGVMTLALGLGWAVQSHRNPAANLRNALLVRRDLKYVDEAGMTVPLLQNYAVGRRSRIAFLEEWWTHPDPTDTFWKDQEHRDSLDTYACPVLVQSGWYDVFLESSIGQYERLAARGADVRLTVGPWSHLTFEAKGLSTVLAEAADFLRAASGLAPPLTIPRVRLLDARSGAERQIHVWPPASDSERHYLAPGAMQPDVAGHDVRPTSFTYDPNSPTPQVGGALYEPGAGPVDNSELEARADVVTFDMPPLAADAEYIGTPSVELWISSDVPKPQLFVRLNLVDSTGRSTNITDTIVAVSANGDDPVRVSVTLPPTCLAVRSGERFRLVVAGGAFPRFARSPGTGESPATATTFLAARIDIHHDSEHPSSLTLPHITTR